MYSTVEFECALGHKTCPQPGKPEYCPQCHATWLEKTFPIKLAVRYAQAFFDVKQKDSCDHGVTFDEQAAQGLGAFEIQQRWPRLNGLCPKGCGYDGIYYASSLHYYAGDW